MSKVEQWVASRMNHDVGVRLGIDAITELTEIAAAKATRCDELFEELERTTTIGED